MTPNRDQADLIERMKEAAAKATKGPWEARDDFMGGLAARWSVGRPEIGPEHTLARVLAPNGKPHGTAEANAAYIALCSPDNILSLIARLATTQSALDEAKGALRRCNWYWPEEDTSSETCAESAQEVVQNAYDGSSKMAGKVVPVARGGIVEVTYCASLPPAGDADSDDDFWVQESSEAAAQAKIDAELARRASLTRKAGGEDAQ